MAVIGGQCLSAVAGEGSLTPNVGIVIMALLSLFISFCGFRVLHFYERWASIPAVIAIVVATGCGGEGLKLQSTPPVATVTAVFSFGMIVASYMIPWAALASDFTTYLEPSTPAYVIFVLFFSAWLSLSVDHHLIQNLPQTASKSSHIASQAWSHHPFYS